MYKVLIHISALIILIMEITYLMIAFIFSVFLFGGAIGWWLAGIVYKKMFTVDKSFAS